LYYVPDLNNVHLVQKIRFGFKGKHPTTEATQYNGNDNTPKKGAKKTAKDKSLSPYTTNVPMLPNNKRDEFNMTCIREVFEACATELEKDEFWEAMGRPDLKPKNVRGPFKMPYIDASEGAVFKIKFVFNVFTGMRKFELFDFRIPKKNNKVPSALPQTIKNGNHIDGTFEVDDLYIRPNDQAWGFSLIWSAARVHKGEALLVSVAVVLYYVRSGGNCILQIFLFQTYQQAG